MYGICNYLIFPHSEIRCWDEFLLKYECEISGYWDYQFFVGLSYPQILLFCCRAGIHDVSTQAGHIIT